MPLPMVARVQQPVDATRLDDPSRAVMDGLQRLGLEAKLPPRASVAITAGSRGIRNLVEITRAAVSAVRSIGREPFIVPAMGSHGGATDEGQRQLLADLGISQESMGCPVRSSMEVEAIGRTASGVPVYVDRHALHADGIVVINRVKPHTAFHGDVESGLCKMLAVGLGKERGARQMHGAGLGAAVVDAARVMLANAPVLAGIAILENAIDETADIRVVPPDRFEAIDAELLRRARLILPRIPFEALDVLIVDEMGKNISGTGMDTNVIGVGARVGGKMTMGTPAISSIVVLALTPESHGNAVGVGLADLTTRRLVDAIDYKATYANVRTTRLWSAGRVPIICETDREAIEIAVGDTPPDVLRLVRIRNTLNLERLEISPALLPDAARSGLTITHEPRPLEFDGENRLRSWNAGG